jgi:hypothetical protein
VWAFTQFAAACEKVDLSLSMPWRHIGGAEVLLHLFLTSELCGQSDLPNAPAIFLQEKEPQYTLYRRLCGHSQCGHFGEGKIA